MWWLLDLFGGARGGPTHYKAGRVDQLAVSCTKEQLPSEQGLRRRSRNRHSVVDLSLDITQPPRSG